MDNNLIFGRTVEEWIKLETELKLRDIKNTPLLDGVTKQAQKPLIDLITELLQPFPDPCHYDHHGYCQEHFLHERPCPFERAKEWLK